MNEEFTAEEIKGMMKGFIAKALSMGEIESYCIVACDKEGMKFHSVGSDMHIYGMMDFFKRRMFIDMARKTHHGKQNREETSDEEPMEDIRAVVREELKNG